MLQKWKDYEEKLVLLSDFAVAVLEHLWLEYQKLSGLCQFYKQDEIPVAKGRFGREQLHLPIKPLSLVLILQTYQCFLKMVYVINYEAKIAIKAPFYTHACWESLKRQLNKEELYICWGLLHSAVFCATYVTINMWEKFHAKSCSITMPENLHVASICFLIFSLYI